jgi:LysM repeat protein/predicted chitinase
MTTAFDDAVNSYVDSNASLERNLAVALEQQGILSPNVLAYALATVKHETAGTMKPIREYGGPQQAKKLGYKGGENFYGRGYIQLTHDYNYKDIGKKLGMGDALYKNPDLALDPAIAAKILAVFFKDRGVAAAAEKGDFYGARRGVNGTDKAEKIAQLAKQYLPTAKKVAANPTIALQQAKKQAEQQNPMVPTPNVGPIQSFIKAISPKQVMAQEPIPKPVSAPQKTKQVVDPYSQKGWEQAQSDYIQTKVNNGEYYGKSQGNYVIKPGDTLSGLAKAYNTTLSDFMRANPTITNANVIRAGATINVPSSPTSVRVSAPSSSGGGSAPSSSSGGYVIRTGDTLGAIAKKLGTTVNDLARKNNIANPNLIYAGVKLKT